MNQEQYTNAMLKIAYHAGRAMAIEEIEKEAAGEVIKQTDPIRKPSVAPTANQAGHRDVSKAVTNINARNTQSQPRALSRSLKPKPGMEIGKRMSGQKTVLKSTQPRRP